MCCQSDAERSTPDQWSVTAGSTSPAATPKAIASWFAGTSHLIALHCGRSGALAFDVDDPEAVPDVLRKHLGAAAYQNTRPDNPDRGHYVFGMPPGRVLGNSNGRLGKGWGDVRGANGIIVVAPAPGRCWKRTGPLPVLPDEIAQHLPNGAPRDGTPPPRPVTVAAKPGGNPVYVANAVRNELTELASAREGCRNNTLAKVAVAVFEFVKGAHFDETVARTELERIALAIGLTHAEIEATLRHNWAKAKPRTIPAPGVRAAHVLEVNPAELGAA